MTNILCPKFRFSPRSNDQIKTFYIIFYNIVSIDDLDRILKFENVYYASY
jgi:hypothetical protein